MTALHPHAALPVTSPVAMPPLPAPSPAKKNSAHYRCACCIPRAAFLQLLHDVHRAAHDADWRQPAPLTRPMLWTCMAAAWQAQPLGLSGAALPAAGSDGAAPLVRRRGGPSKAPGGAERVLSGGRIFTADRTHPWCEALAIDEGRIVATGTRAEIEAWIGERTEVIELQGRLVIPGFNDAHMHHTPDPAGIRLPVDPVVDPGFAQVAPMIEEAVAGSPAGTWIYGVMGIGLSIDRSVTRDALDALAPRHPVILLGMTNHTNVVNSAALQRLGISDDEPDPLGGTYERVAGTRRLSGRINEYAQWAPQRTFASMATRDEGVDSLRALAADCVRWGITTLQNMSWTPAARYVEMLKAADLPIKVRVIRFPPSGPQGRLVSEGRELPRQVAPRIRVDGTKWILDGTPVERASAIGRAYGDDPTTQGRENFAASDVREMLRESIAAREPLLLHAIGAQTLETVLACAESFGPDVDWRDPGLRIEHADGITPAQIDRTKALGVTVVQNPSHFLFGDLYSARFGADTPFAAFRSLFGAGIPVALGSDGPLNPFLGLYAAVVHPARPDEAASMEDALRAYTHGSAVAEGLGEHKGRLVPGACADLAVLSQDLFSIAPSEIPATHSLLTLVDGHVVHEHVFTPASSTTETP
ncbi:N-substituted formamide deformylase precursor [compost metagenome]